MENTYTITLSGPQAQRLLDATYTDRPGDEYRRMLAELAGQGFQQAQAEELAGLKPAFHGRSAQQIWAGDTPQHVCGSDDGLECPCVEQHIDDGGCYEVVSSNPPERDE